MSVDPVTALSDPVGYFGRYHYAANNPYTFTDPDGRAWGLASKIVKVIVKGGDVAATFAGAVEDGRVLLSRDASLGQRAMAAGSLASEVLSPVSARDVKAGAAAIEGAAGTLRNPNKLAPYRDPVTGKGADGPHTSFRTNSDGKVTNYETYDVNPRTGDFGAEKRFRGEGKAHGGQEPPLVLERSGAGTPDAAGPGARPVVPRAPRTDELPKGY